MDTQKEISNEKNYLEKKKLTELIFEKARNASMETAKTALANYIEDNSALKFKTSTRMYDRYILGDNGKSITSMYNLNLGAKYIGYENFADFCHKNFPETNDKKEKKISEVEEENRPFISSNKASNKNFLKRGLAGLGIASVLGFGSYLGINGGEADCMYWTDTHYSKIGCEEDIHPNTERKPYDEQLYKYFHRIFPTDTTSFFEAGEPIVWYLKVGGEVEFYSSPGNHPITGKQLKPVTSYIVNKYGAAKK